MGLLRLREKPGYLCFTCLYGFHRINLPLTAFNIFIGLNTVNQIMCLLVGDSRQPREILTQRNGRLTSTGKKTLPEYEFRVSGQAVIGSISSLPAFAAAPADLRLHAARRVHGLVSLQLIMDQSQWTLIQYPNKGCAARPREVEDGALRDTRGSRDSRKRYLPCAAEGYKRLK